MTSPDGYTLELLQNTTQFIKIGGLGCLAIR